MFYGICYLFNLYPIPLGGGVWFSGLGLYRKVVGSSPGASRLLLLSGP